MFIEVFLSSNSDTVEMTGTANSLKKHSPGLRFEIMLDPAYTDEYRALVRDRHIESLPTEYYRANWRSFNGGSRTATKLNLTVSLIDASKIRLHNGTDFYLQKIIASSLSDSQRAGLSRTYRDELRSFSNHEDIAAINTELSLQVNTIFKEPLNLSIDTSDTNGWEDSLSPFLGELPASYAGSGEQSALKVILATARQSDNSHIMLLEEPENHLSFSTLNQLLNQITTYRGEKQLILSTHSSYVINKLGIDQLMLLRNNTVTRLTDLDQDTLNYFRKLPGYDTLRLVLAKKSILVEGPSDELVVTRAYMDHFGGRRPIEDGVDIISMDGLSFKRFLDIAAKIGCDTMVVTDNDGDIEALKRKYRDYDQYDNIKICYSTDTTNQTLEPQIVSVNDSIALANILSQDTTTTKPGLVDYMTKNKVDCALKILDANKPITMPKYILEAIGAS